MAPSTETITLTAPTLRLRSEEVESVKPEPDLLDNEIMKAMDNIPTFTDKHEERKWAKAQLAAAFRVFAKLGYADGCAGHVSLRGSHTFLQSVNTACLT